MFDPREGFEVTVRPLGSPDAYHEWKAPVGSEFYAAQRNECYIEAVTGERFSVRVVRHPIARWRKRTTALGITCLVDETFEDFGTLEKSAQKGIAEHETLTVDFREFLHGTENGTKHAGFQFGEVQTVDDPTFLSGDEETDEISKRGKIEIFIKHGWCSHGKNTRREKIMEGALELQHTLPEQTTKKVSHEAGKSHFVQPVVLRDYIPSDVYTSFRSNDEARDATDDTIKFTFFYTTRMFMEINRIMSIIPYPNTRAEATTIDEHAPSPRPRTDTPVGPRPAPAEEVTFVSTNRKSEDREVIKVESDDDEDDRDNDDEEYQNGFENGSDDGFDNADNGTNDIDSRRDWSRSPTQGDRISMAPQGEGPYTTSSGLDNRTTVDPGSPGSRHDRPPSTNSAAQAEPGNDTAQDFHEDVVDYQEEQEDIYGSSVQGEVMSELDEDDDIKPEIDDEGNILLTPRNSSYVRDGTPSDVHSHRARSRAARRSRSTTATQADESQAGSTRKRRRERFDMEDSRMELEDIKLSRRAVELARMEIAIKRKMRAARSES